MNFILRLSSQAWLAALVGAAGFLVWIDVAQVRRVEYVSGLAEPAVAVDAGSPTGYAAGLRRLIVPEHNNESYQWIAQTQQMLARGEGRVRHVDYDNAPVGREVRAPSPYRWWLGLVAWCNHVASGLPLGLATERAALYADPVLQLLLLAGAALFAARQFGTFPAALLALGWAALFPFAGVFLPGQPNDGGLTQAAAFWSTLLLLAGLRPPATPDRDPGRAGLRTERWFLLAGIAGGIGVWINAARMLPVIGGIAVGGFVATGFARRARSAGLPTATLPWRHWALGGATTCLVAYVIEYFPVHMDALRLETIHPVFGIGWLATGELLRWAAAGPHPLAPLRKLRQAITLVLAVLAVAAVPAAAILTGHHRFLADDGSASRLTLMADGPVAQSLRAWLFRDGFNTMVAATFLPLLLLVPAIWLLVRGSTSTDRRTGIALALGPLLVTLGLACFQLGWWSMADSCLLVLLAATTASGSHGSQSATARWSWAAGVALALAPGAVVLLSPLRAEQREVVTPNDVVALIERDLAHWLAGQAGSGGAVVLAPPSLTTSLYFHGGLAGLGTPYWENKDGFAAAVRIAGATTPDEAQAVARTRNLTYIVLPSWDLFMDEYARLGSGKAEHSLVALLHGWLPPRWLRPVPYHLPKIPGFEGMSVAVFQVVELQDNATALSRLAEYFVEMGQLDTAAAVSQALGRLFPGDLGAQVARALVAQAQGDARGFAEAINALAANLTQGDESALPWDRRVSLAIALAEAKRFPLARAQVQRCLAELDEPRLRSLTPVSLYRLQVIIKAFGLEISDPRLRSLSRNLLPAELRGEP